MAVDVKVDDVLTDVDTDDTVIEPKGADTEPKVDDNSKTEIVFDDLDDGMKSYIDRERTQASRTAREKALRDAVKDPEVEKAIRSKIEREANLTAEEKVSERERGIAERENRIEAREKLLEAGITGEDLTKVLQFVVSEDKDSTVAKTETFIETFNAMVASATEAKTRELIKSTPKPKNSNGTTSKDFKSMSLDDRAKLRETDPARYKAEMDKSRTKI